MADTEILLRDEMGLRIPSVHQVSVTTGGKVTFVASDDADSALYFSPQAVSILAPKPDAGAVVTSGKSLSFTFESAAPGVFVAIAQAPEDPPPTDFDDEGASSSAVLFIRSGKGSAFPVATNTPGG